MSTQILVRHAAYTPTPPDYVVCGLLRLMAFPNLQNVTLRFEVNVRYKQFSGSSLPVFFAYILH